MDVTVNYNKKITEKDSLWSLIKSFFSTSVDEEELNRKRIEETEAQQDNEYIEYIKNSCKSFSSKKGKSKLKEELEVESESKALEIEKGSVESTRKKGKGLEK